MKFTEEYVMGIYGQGWKDWCRGCVQSKTDDNLLEQMFYFNGVLDAIMEQVSFNNQDSVTKFNEICYSDELGKYANYFKYLQLLEKTKYINGFSIQEQLLNIPS